MININDVYSRRQYLERDNQKKSTVTAKNILESAKNPNVEISYLLNSFSESANGSNANKYIKPFINVLNGFVKSDSEYLNEAMNYFEKFIDYVSDNKTLLEAVSNSLIPNKDEIINRIDTNVILDRIYNNHAKISKRFKLNESLEMIASDEPIEEVVESVCSLIDTYDMPIHKKINISLEELAYLYSTQYKTANINELVNTITEFYINLSPSLTDKDINKMKSIVKENDLLSDSDIPSVLTIDSTTARERLIELSNTIGEESYRHCIEEIYSCNSFIAAQVTIKRTISTIYNSYVILNAATKSSTLTLFKALYSISLIIGMKPATITSEIYSAVKTIMVEVNDEEVNNRLNDLLKDIDVITTRMKNENDIYGESSKMLDEELSYRKSIINNTYNNQFSLYTESVIDYSKYVNEAEIVDSNDIIQSINKYKLQEHKDSNTFTRLVKSWFVKSPKSITDDLPHILKFIRIVGILGVFSININTIGPILGLIAFIANYCISQHFNRVEANKMLKFFRNEEKIVDKKLEKATGEKKEKLEKYKKELHKAVLNIEQYRNSWYSEKELDKIRDEELLESACNELPKITVGEYFINNHSSVVSMMDHMMKMFESYMYSNPICKYEQTRSNGDTVSEWYRDCSPTTISKYVTEEGYLSVPIYKISDIKNYDQIIECCNHIGSDYQAYKITPEFINEGGYILFNAYIPLDLKYSINTENTINEYDLELSASILETESILESYNVDKENILDEVADYMNELAYAQDIKEFAELVRESRLNTRQFIFKLQEQCNQCSDILKYINMNTALEAVQHNPITEPSDGLKQSVIEACEVLLTEAKENNKNIQKKGIMGVLKDGHQKVKKNIEKQKDEIKSNMGNITNKTKDGKIAITTNLGLAIEAMKKGVQNLSTKEKEISRNIDSSLAYFKRGIEKSLTTNRREAIIKGSIIPSFSKSIKLAIAGGVAFAINPIVGAIGCIGALACSKALTEKERKLLLDEIDIELQVVNREIENTNSDTSSAKYRQLITYKKQLMRESQRIRYRIKVYSKDNVPPMSEV